MTDAMNEANEIVNTYVTRAGSIEAILPLMKVISIFDKDVKEEAQRLSDLDASTNMLISELANIFEVKISDVTELKMSVFGVEKAKHAMHLVQNHTPLFLSPSMPFDLLMRGVKTAAYTKAVGLASITYLAKRSPLRW